MKIRELFEEQLSDDAKIKEFIKNYRNGAFGYWQFESKFPIHKVRNGKVDIGNRPIKITNGLVEFDGPNAGELMIQFDGTAGQIQIRCDKLTSFKGFPPKVTNAGNKDWKFAAIVFERFNTKLTSLEGISPEIYGDVIAANARNISYSNVHKHIKLLKGSIGISESYTGPLLGFLKIPEFVRLSSPVHKLTPLGKAIEIINKHLKENKNVLNCQEELIDNGLEEFATL